MSKFEPFGPYQIPVDGKLIDMRRKEEFWQRVEDEEAGLPDAVGCYIYAVRAGPGVRPWYVGKTERLSFRKEAFKFNVVALALSRRKKGTLLLYLLAARTDGGKLKKPAKSSIRSIGALEELLIGTCLRRNPRLLNKKVTRHFREIEVPGYMNESPGARSVKARALAGLLKVAKNSKE